jgi:hypothetical protein
VSVSKVEALLNSIGEMVILQSVIKEQAIASQSLTLKKTLHQLEKVSKEIQDISMSLRMVPVKPTFQKMQRIVRDTAQALGKDVAIQLVGEETELDKTVLEKINDPLVHLIRNSVDHGIENSDIRTSKGKSAKGKVTLSAFHRSGKLILEVSDDGGGLDPQKLMKKAVEKGDAISVAIYLLCGADPNKPGKDGKTTFQVAKDSANPTIRERIGVTAKEELTDKHPAKPNPSVQPGSANLAFPEAKKKREAKAITPAFTNPSRPKSYA